jgi:hypothetical protein
MERSTAVSRSPPHDALLLLHEGVEVLGELADLILGAQLEAFG